MISLRTAGLETELERALRWSVDPAIGLVKQISELTHQPGEPDVFIFAAEFQDPGLVAPTSVSAKLFGAGAAVTKEGALWAALGEAAERYAGGVYFPDDLLHAPYREVADHALNPEDLILFSEEQYADPDFSFARFDANKTRAWTCAFDLTHGRDVLVPAELVYFGYVGSPAAEMLDNSYSTGLSASHDYPSAAASAIREVIERDAFSCHWYAKVPPKRVRLEDAAAVASPSVRRLLGQPELDVHVLDITTEFAVPCIFTAVRRRHGRGVAVGASCRLDAGAAMEKALVEAYHGLNWILDTDRSGLGALDADAIQDFEDHTRYYFEPDRIAKLDFLFEGPVGELPKSMPASDGARGELAALVDILRVAGHRVLLVDLTPADVRQLGFVVVRAIVPGLHPLSCGVFHQHLDDRRVRAFCASRELQVPRPLNRDPHPFP